MKCVSGMSKSRHIPSLEVHKSCCRCVRILDVGVEGTKKSRAVTMEEEYRHIHSNSMGEGQALTKPRHREEEKRVLAPSNPVCRCLSVTIILLSFSSLSSPPSLTSCLSCSTSFCYALVAFLRSCSRCPFSFFFFFSVVGGVGRCLPFWEGTRRGMSFLEDVEEVTWPKRDDADCVVPSLGMTLEQFLVEGKKMIDEVAEYYGRIESMLPCRVLC